MTATHTTVAMWFQRNRKLNEIIMVMAKPRRRLAARDEAQENQNIAE
jgi:hypothetical protein